MRKRVSEIIAMSLLCACLALAGTTALAVAGLLDVGPAAQAQESGGGQQAAADADGGGKAEPEAELTEWQKARIAEYEDARDAAAGASGQAAQGMISGLAPRMNVGASTQFTVEATGLNTYFWHGYVFHVRSLDSDGSISTGGIGFNSGCSSTVTSATAPRRASTYSETLTLHACAAGRYQVTSHLRLINYDEEPEDPEYVTTVDTDSVIVTVVGGPTPTDTPTPTTPAPTLSAPPAPSNFRVTSTGLTSARLAWSAQSNISRFQISGGPRNVHPTRSSASFTVTGLTCGTAYTFSIRAEGDDTNTKGWSAWSSASGTTSACPPPVITISSNHRSVTEGQNARFTLRANRAPASNLTVSVRVTESGSFISGRKPTSVTISANRRTATLTVATNNDSADENHGSITAQALSGTGYTVSSTASSARVTVLDNDPPSVSISWNRSPIDEGQNAEFTLTASTAPTSNLTVAVRVTEDGSFISGTKPTSVRISRGSRTATLTVRTTNDRTDEDHGSITARVRSGTGYTVGSPSFARVTVRDDDDADKFPAFGTTTTISDKTWTHNKAITNFTLPRATGGDGTLTYSLSRSGQSSGASALPAGVSRSAHSVSGTPSALLANTTFTWTATDSDGDKASLTFKIKVLPQVSIARKKAEVAEGQRAEFILTASAAPLANLAVTVRVTQSGTFISGTAPVSATISAGQTTATLSVPTTKDSVDEADGSVRAEVRTGTGYAVGSAASASVSVRDTPRISIAAGTSPVTEGANATFTITAAGAPLSSISIPVSVTQSGAFIKGTKPTRVTIAANGTTATLTVATENDATDETNGSITATLSGNAASPYVVVSGSSSASVTVNDNDVKLAMPANFTVTPLPQRKARLDWPMVTGAPKYRIEITGGGASGAFILTHNNAPAVSSEIDLDSILNGKGLADANAYQFKVKAIYDTDNSDASDPYVDSDFSSVVEVRDTPIISINGDSSGRADRKGQAVVTWNAVTGATVYTLRWRKLPRHKVQERFLGFNVSRLVPHSDDRWRPQAAGEGDWSEPLRVSGTTSTIGGLDLGDVYAFQLNYTTANGQGFSVREAYVWPSNGFPSDRVATYPFFGHWPSKAYSYTICRNTFPTGTQDRWVSLINAAFGAWSTSTSGVVTAVSTTSDHCEEAPMKIVGSLFNDHNEVIMVDTTDIGYEDFTAFVEGFITEGRIRRFLRGAGALLTNRDQIRYTLPYCIFDQGTHKANACVVSPSYVKVLGPQASTDLTRASGSVDVLIDETPRTLNIPSDTGFNSCDGDYRAYRLVLHEAGHAFGISGFSLARLEDERSIYVMAHPTIADSVMNYDEQTHVEEPDCSPHPFDILAIQALYQTVD